MNVHSRCRSLWLLFVPVVSLIAPCAHAWVFNGSPVCTVNRSQSNQVVMPDGVGGVFIVWADPRHTGTTAPDIYAQRLDASGAPLWAVNGVPVTTAAASQTGHAVIADGAGGIIVVWADDRDNGTSALDIYAQRLDASGTALWTANGLPVTAATSNQSDHRIVSDGAGGVIVVWADTRNNGTTALDLYAQRLGPAGNALWPVNGVSVSAALGNQSNHELVPDTSGGVIVVWSDTRNTGTSSLDIYAQRMDASGTALWTADGAPMTTAPSVQSNHLLVQDGAGGVIAVWSDDRDNGTSALDVYAQRLDPNGNTMWTPNGAVVSAALGNQSNHELVQDTSGGVIVVWSDTRNTGTSSLDIYAQRIGAGGGAQWATNGIPVTTAAYFQSNHRLVQDGAGGVIAVWLDDRDNGTSALDIYAQRLSTGGSALWAANGVPVTTAPTIQTDHEIVTDGAGGVIVVWTDERDNGTTSLDLYAQQINASGIALCTPDGVPLTTAPRVQTDHTTVSPSPGAAVVVWGDQRDTGVSAIDLYAQRFCSCTPGGIACTVPVFVTSLSVRAARAEAEVTWRMDGDAMVAVFRAELGGVWQPICDWFEATGGAATTYRDRSVRAGVAYDYAIGIRTDADVTLSTPVRLEAVALPLALRVFRGTEATLASVVEFDLPSAGHVQLDLYSVAGRKVRTLFQGERAAGSGRIALERGDTARGIYLVQLLSPWGVCSERVLLR